VNSSVVGGRLLMVRNHQSYFLVWNFVESQELFRTFRGKSFFFIENGTLQQPLYSTHGTSPVLDSSLWLAVIIDYFFTEKVKEILVLNSQKPIENPKLKKYIVQTYILVFKVMKPW